jgi:hypothetical protein
MTSLQVVLELPSNSCLLGKREWLWSKTALHARYDESSSSLELPSYSCDGLNGYLIKHLRALRQLISKQLTCRLERDFGHKYDDICQIVLDIFVVQTLMRYVF